jgi:hypothetical protein
LGRGDRKYRASENGQIKNRGAPAIPIAALLSAAGRD